MTLNLGSIEETLAKWRETDRMLDELARLLKCTRAEIPARIHELQTDVEYLRDSVRVLEGRT